MILVPKYCWERVQEHRIILGIQYHDLRTSIGAYIGGKRKKSLKNFKRPKGRIFGPFWGGFIGTRLCSN